MDIRAEVLTIGDEILWGQITDTNTQFISAALADIGIRTVHKTSVGDDEPTILDALAAAFSRAEVVLMTGGLGPTKDDITKTTLAKYFDSALVEHPQAWADTQAFFAYRNRPINDLNRLQATLPDKAVYIQNERGTAPGMWFEAGDDKVAVSMPGVPSEMRHMMQNQILPRLQKRYKTPAITHRFLQTIGIGESDLAQKIEAWEDALPPHVKLAYLPSRGSVKLRLTGIGEDAEALGKVLDALADKAAPLIGANLFSRTDQEIEQALADLFVKENLTLSAAESCTGGAFASRLTAQAGASLFFHGSAVVYTENAKRTLGVDPTVIERCSVYSIECAEAMAEAARRFYGTHYAVSSTGLAGPATPEDPLPVGTIFIACAGPAGTISRELNLTPERAANIEFTVISMLNLVRLQVLETLGALPA